MKRTQLILALVLGIATVVPAMAQNPTDEGRKISRAAAGQKQKVKGVIVKRDPDGFVLRDMNGSDWSVTLTNATEVKERKSNIFRGAQKYGVTSLIRGLNVEVEGVGDGTGSVVAKSVKATQDELAMARTTDARVTPVEGRVGDAEGRLTQSEENAKRLSGQIDELSAISNAARGGAKAAQESADVAIAGVNATNQRISDIDDYEERKAVAVNFKAGKFELSPESKSILDAIAMQAKQEKAYIIEIRGHASAEGKLDLNRKLSQNRADEVVRYLAETHNIPQRRIVTPFGYGVAQPMADNTTKDGREQNRRVEVKILVSKGMMAPVNVTKPASASSANEVPTTNSKVVANVK
jgi:outer membrane protein OmpA-like peptidoglycan-associated protein